MEGDDYMIKKILQEMKDPMFVLLGIVAVVVFIICVLIITAPSPRDLAPAAVVDIGTPGATPAVITDKYTSADCENTGVQTDSWFVLYCLRVRTDDLTIEFAVDRETYSGNKIGDEIYIVFR